MIGFNIFESNPNMQYGDLYIIGKLASVGTTFLSIIIYIGIEVFLRNEVFLEILGGLQKRIKKLLSEKGKTFKNNQSRTDFLDQLKGLGIILVVIGHFIEPYREIFSIINSIFIGIYTFHMPLFCLLSGMAAKFNVIKIIFKMGWICALSQLLYLSLCVIVDSENFIRG